MLLAAAATPLAVAFVFAAPVAAEPMAAEPTAAAPAGAGAGAAAGATRPAPATGPRAPVPPVREQQRAGGAIRTIFPAEFAQRAPAARADLARKLLGAVEATQNDAAVQYVLLREAADAAAAAGEVELALQASDALAARFAVDPFEVRVAVLAQLQKGPLNEDGARAVVARLLDLVDQAFAASDYSTAAKLATQADAAARLSRNAEAMSRASRRAGEVKRAYAEYVRVKPAFDRLKANPDEPASHTQVGRFLCFVRGDWEAGLPHLAKGAEGPLKEVARKDLTAPTSAPLQGVMGDAWWEAGQKEGLSRDACLARAVAWYAKALPQLEGLAQVRAKSRVEEFGRKSTGPTGPAGPGAEVTLMWSCSDVADLYLNGQPLRKVAEPFTTRKDEAPQIFSADVVLRRGDVLTVGARSGGAAGILLIGLDRAKRVVLKTDAHWRWYEPADPNNWYVPEVALRSTSMPADVVPDVEQWQTQKKLNGQYGGDLTSIWRRNVKFVFLYCVIE